MNYDGTGMVTEVSGLSLPFGLDLDLSLDQCQADLGQCQTDSLQCQIDLAQASSDLGQCQTDLGQCGTDLDQANTDLGQCQTDLSQTASDLSQCQADLGTTLGDLATCSTDLAAADAQLVDPDGDGIPFVSDRCAGSGAVGVDADGCSLAQFCEAIDASAPQGNRRCRRSDWRNDEAIMPLDDRDCQVEENAIGRADDQCVVAL